MRSIRLTAASLAALSLAACGGSGDDRTAARAAATPQPTATPVVPRFSAAGSSRGCGATVRWAGSSAGAGVIFGQFQVTVAPGHRCRVRGLPSVTLLDAAGRARPTRAGRDRLVSGRTDYARTVEIRAGHPAFFQVIYGHGLPSGRACRQAFGIDVRLTPGHVHHRVPVSPRGGVDDHHAFNPCGGAIGVTAIEPDASH